MLVQRFDFSPISKATRTSQGFLRFDANLSKVGVFEYRTVTGSIQRELRHPGEVFHADSLATMGGATVTDLHPGMVDPSNVTSLQKGRVSDSVKHDGKCITGHVTIQDQALIGKIDSGDRKELSPGYQCSVEMTPGVWNGKKYDGIQRSIRYNHVGIGPAGWGRQGSDVSLRLDGSDAASDLDNLGGDPIRKKEVIVDRMIKLDGIEHKMDSDATRQIIERTIEKADGEVKTAKTELSEMTGKFDGVVKERDELKAKLDSANDPARIDKLVNDRADLVASARKILGDEFKMDGMAGQDIKIAVLKKSDEKFDGTGKEVGYINGLFDYTIKNHKPESREDGLDKARRIASGRQDGNDKGGQNEPEIDHYDAESAEQRMIERNQNAWKQ